MSASGDSDSDTGQHVDEDSNLAFGRSGSCLAFAVRSGGYDWIRQRPTHNTWFAAEYDPTASGTLYEENHEVSAESEEEDDALISAFVNSLSYSNQQVATGWQHGSGSSSSGGSSAGGEGGG
eukprot:11732814-Karenia_brevis.AAC.1